MVSSAQTIPEARRSFYVMDAEVHLRLTSAETEGRYCAIELSLPAGFAGAPMHFHREMAERFVVLEGSLEIAIAGQSMTLRAGESAVASPGDVHCFRNTSGERAQLLLLVTPAGHERFFVELMEWMEREPTWPPADRRALAEFGKRHDTEYVQPAVQVLTAPEHR